MSQENVEIVRRFNAAHEQENLIPLIRAAVERVGPDPTPEAVMEVWGEDPGWRYLHADIEWDVSATGALGEATRGARDVAVWWAQWVEVWDSYVYRMGTYRDLGDWVLTPVEIEAHGRDGITVAMDIFNTWLVRDGKIAVQRSFLSEDEALEAVGLRE
jgi:ketosteroid isomerase-like protein